MLFESHSFLTPMSEVWPGGSLSKGKLQAIPEITIVVVPQCSNRNDSCKIGLVPSENGVYLNQTCVDGHRPKQPCSTCLPGMWGTV